MLRVLLAIAMAGLPAEPLDADAGPPCWSFTQESRPTGYGYRHVVIVKNACKKQVACNVSTDVNPDAINVSVPPSESREVVTFYEAPGAGFTAKVQCK